MDIIINGTKRFIVSFKWRQAEKNQNTTMVSCMAQSNVQNVNVSLMDMMNAIIQNLLHRKNRIIVL